MAREDLALVVENVAAAIDAGAEAKFLMSATEGLIDAVVELRKICAWSLDDENGDWNTSCGEVHILCDGTPADYSYKFCCYCGGTLVHPADDSPLTGGH